MSHASSTSPISRKPLWHKVADAIQRDITEGNWTNTLPGEHQLSSHYEVGRRSIRDALQRLEEEGVIKTAPGKPRAILAAEAKTNQPSPYPDHVILLSPYAQDQGIAKSRILFNRTFQELSKRGIHFVSRRVDGKTSKALDRNLGQLKEQFPRSIWLLHDCSGRVQRWCHDQKGRALILGAKDPTVPYSSVEMDADSVIAHAVDYLEKAGHERNRILLLMRRDPGKNNENTSRLFQSHMGIQAKNSQILWHDDANMIDGLRKTLSRKSPPSALICWRTHDAIRAVTYLTHQGVSIPKSLSVISCGCSPAMDFIYPNITRFLSPTADYERCFLRLLIRLIEGAGEKERDYQFVPEFLCGETVAGSS